VSQNEAYLILFKIKKLEPKIVFLTRNILMILAGKNIYNLVSNLIWVWWIDGRAGEGTDGHRATDSTALTHSIT